MTDTLANELQDQIDRLEREHATCHELHRAAELELEQLRTALAKHHPKHASLVGGRWCSICDLLV